MFDLQSIEIIETEWQFYFYRDFEIQIILSYYFQTGMSCP